MCHFLVYTFMIWQHQDKEKIQSFNIGINKKYQETEIYKRRIPNHSQKITVSLGRHLRGVKIEPMLHVRLRND